MSQGHGPENKTPSKPESARSLWTARAPSGHSPLSALSRNVDPSSIDRDIASSTATAADELARPFARVGVVQELGDILLD